jgi:hypothetical protein
MTPQKSCDFDGFGKILHQIRQKIAALLATKATLDTKLVIGLSGPQCGQVS